MSYADPRIQECILTEFLVNRNIWHIKVPLIVFAMVEMHKFDQVMRQLKFRQSILPSPQDIEKLHEVNLLERIDEVRRNAMKNISTFGSIGIQLATFLDYMIWFRHHNKPYLLSEEERTRQHRHRRPRQSCMNPRSGVHASMESSSAPTLYVAPTS
ncbi:hypothetical protein Goshw_008250 [Gossypium schwendimanii]|uniref:Uncharacterized protein n=1 Tax=Gossypium schwendimanii TaxID=34291 RepID=A0A7J9MMF2_GOSSC|nr:hypothetical protein [Gossypium schwendimanii]